VAVEPGEVPGLIDEIPILAVVATQAEGVTEVRGAGELRVKETDRIATTVSELRRMGAKIEALPDGFVVEGPVRLRGAEVSSHGDHRLAMSLAIAALVAEGETTVEDTACIADSFPGFEQAVQSLGVAL
jgi:3-phosphoshikimate 1-carboxyvinyltransferase